MSKNANPSNRARKVSLYSFITFLSLSALLAIDQ